MTNIYQISKRRRRKKPDICRRIICKTLPPETPAIGANTTGTLIFSNLVNAVVIIFF